MSSVKEEIRARFKELEPQEKIEQVKKVLVRNKENFAKYLIFSGFALVVTSLLLFILIFYPVITQELNYAFSGNKGDEVSVVVKKEANLVKKESENNAYSEDIIEPVDPEFSIIVPKIKANAKIIQNVDPYNSKEYQLKLTQGVAHASGSALPEELGNTFLFAHSSDNFYNANRYNAIFYLLNKMLKILILNIKIVF